MCSLSSRNDSSSKSARLCLSDNYRETNPAASDRALIQFCLVVPGSFFQTGRTWAGDCPGCLSEATPGSLVRELLGGGGRTSSVGTSTFLFYVFF